MSEDNKEDESDDEEANAAAEEQLRKVEQEFTQNEKTSHSVSLKLAAVVGNMWLSQADESKTKGRQNKYLRPENCTGSSVPKVNPEIQIKDLKKDQKRRGERNIRMYPGLTCHSEPGQSGSLRKKEGANQARLII